MTDALAMEDGSSAYVNVLVCKEGNEEEPKIKLWSLPCRASRSRTLWTEELRRRCGLRCGGSHRRLRFQH